MNLLPPAESERHRLCRLLLLCAFGCLAFGFIIDFFPGSEEYWFILVACLFLAPTLIPRGGYRVIGVAFVFISLVLALRGHWRGVEYQTWLSEHPHNIIAVVNETEHNLEGIELRFIGVKNTGPGQLAKGEYDTLDLLREPVPNKALVTWDEGSIHHEVTVSLVDVVSPKFANNKIYFILRADGSVTIKTASIRDSAANQEILKGLTKRRDQIKP